MSFAHPFALFLLLPPASRRPVHAFPTVFRRKNAAAQEEARQ